MESLDNLTDQQLKTKLMEFGFANLPITDTTRKVLLKKLKNAIDSQKVKSRRETIAVTKFSSDEEVELVEIQKPRAKTPQNRRATIAVTEKTSTKKATNGTAAVTNGRADTPSKSKTPSRRSSRATPAQQLQEDSDDDNLPLISQVSTRRSSSRTGTPTNLGVSETVRTTYKSTQPVVEEADIIFETEEVAEPVVVASKSTRRKTITTSSSNLPERSTPTNFRRTTITTSYNPRGASRSNDDEADKVEISEATTPYLSNFAKRLSTLKAEPLDPGMQKYRNESTSSYTSYPRTSVAATSSSSQYYKKPQGGIMRDLSKTFDRLEKRYRFRTILYIVAIVLIVIAIYVLFCT